MHYLPCSSQSLEFFQLIIHLKTSLAQQTTDKTTNRCQSLPVDQVFDWALYQFSSLCYGPDQECLRLILKVCNLESLPNSVFPVFCLMFAASDVLWLWFLATLSLHPSFIFINKPFLHNLNTSVQTFELRVKTSSLLAVKLPWRHFNSCK